MAASYVRLGEPAWIRARTSRPWCRRAARHWRGRGALSRSPRALHGPSSARSCSGAQGMTTGSAGSTASRCSRCHGELRSARPDASSSAQKGHDSAQVVSAESQICATFHARAAAHVLRRRWQRSATLTSASTAAWTSRQRALMVRTREPAVLGSTTRCADRTWTLTGHVLGPVGRHGSYVGAVHGRDVRVHEDEDDFWRGQLVPSLCCVGDVGVPHSRVAGARWGRLLRGAHL